MNEINVTVSEGYKLWSKDYDSFDNPLVSMVENHLLEVIGNVQLKTIVEFGCGTGRNLQLFAENGATGTGLDISLEMLDVARTKTTKFDLVEHDINTRSNLVDNSFDTLIFSLVLEHIENLDFVFSEANRVLKTGGEIHLFEIHPFLRLQGKAAHYTDKEGTDHLIPSYQHMISDFQKAAKNNGFSLTHIGEFSGVNSGKSEKLKRYGESPVLLTMSFKSSQNQMIVFSKRRNFKMEKKNDYTARCHCGNISFSFKSEKITKGLRCDCSICIRKGAVMSQKYITAQDFRPIQNMEQLTDYRWNDKMVNHLFCKTCGIYPYHGDAEYGYRVNLGCVDQINPLELEIKVYDGKSMPISDNPGPHPSPVNTYSSRSMS